MGINSFKSKEFKALQKKYYEKIKEAGFEDIEETDSPKEMLKQWHGSYFAARHDPESYKSNTSYYACASRVLHIGHFESASDKSIWERHVNGDSVRRIARELSLKVWVVHKSIQTQRALFTQPMTNFSVNLVVIKEVPLSDDIKDLFFATWLRPLHYDNDTFRAMDSEVFYKSYPKVIENILNRPNIKIKIACLREDEDTILGYSISERPTLHWIYVKKAWRQMGLAKKLIPLGITQYSHFTKLGSYANKPKEWIFNPFI